MVVNVEKLTSEPPRRVMLPQSSLMIRRRAGRNGFAGNQEPDLDELLSDPIMHRLLASDGIGAEHLRALIADVKSRLMVHA
jgi:hypothetical protein